MRDTESAKEDVIACIVRSRNKIVRSLRDLIKFESVMGPDEGLETEAQMWISEKLRILGLEVDTWNVTEDIFGQKLKKQRPNCVGVLGGQSPSLILNGHVDVVPAGDKSKWRYEPFGGALVEGRIIGRGACDAKSGLTAMISAVDCILEAGYKPKGKLIVESVMGEESGEGGTLSAVKRGYVADAAIVAEPTDLEIQPQEGGALWLKLTVPGSSTHTAFRWSGIHAGGKGDSVNAIEKGLKVVEALLDLERQWGLRKTHHLFPRGWTTISPNVIEGGTAVNTVPDSMSTTFNIWYYPTEDPQEVRHEVEDIIHAICKTDCWLRTHQPKIEWLLDYPPATTSMDHPIVRTIRDNHRKVLANEPVLSAFQAVCDMKFLRNEGQMPSVIYGPGSLRMAHAPGEYVTVDSLLNATKVIALTIIDWCRVTRA